MLAKRRLIAHPDHPAPAIEIDVTVSGEGEHALRLGYVLRGALDEISIPSPAPSARTDELWRTTCFEAFLMPGGGPGYAELNLSPSSRWAAYLFDGYRAGMRDADLSALSVAVAAGGGRLVLDASFVLPIAWPARLGLSAVIEEISGRKSYWALAHPVGAPDFHHSDCFALELPAARSTI